MTTFYKLMACFYKELTVLRRDVMGLLLLFIMPAAFLLIITLVQDNSIGRKGESAIKILFVNQDQGELGRAIQTGAKQTKFFSLQQTLNGKPLTIAVGKKVVAQGKYQALLVIPKGATHHFQRYSKQELVGLADPKQQRAPVQLIFDANLPQAVQQGIKNALQTFVDQVRIRAMEQASSDIMGTKLPPKTDSAKLIATSYAQLNRALVRPNAIQQNVPAWAIFGMFFIVVTIAGAFLKERNEGVLQRLHTVPVSYVTVLSGKILAYVLVNLVQLAIMIILGMTVLPWLGTPSLNLGPHLGLVVLVGIAVSLAATGSGLLLGVLVKSYEQASVLGATLVVIAAAIGGIMVPIFLMPPALQQISWISPLRWGHDAFIGLFVRGADFSGILLDLSLLLAYFIVTLVLASVFMTRRD